MVIMRIGFGIMHLKLSQYPGDLPVAIDGIKIVPDECPHFWSQPRTLAFEPLFQLFLLFSG